MEFNNLSLTDWGSLVPERDLSPTHYRSECCAFTYVADCVMQLQDRFTEGTVMHKNAATGMQS